MNAADLLASTLLEGSPDRQMRYGERFALEGILATLKPRLSLIPNGAAFEQMARVAGFEQVELARPRPDHDRQYVRGDRAVLLAR